MEIQKAEKAIERGQIKAIQSIKKTQRDMKLTQKFIDSPLDIKKLDSKIF